jgi:hypothetical protein
VQFSEDCEVGGEGRGDAAGLAGRGGLQTDAPGGRSDQRQRDHCARVQAGGALHIDAHFVPGHRAGAPGPDPEAAGSQEPCREAKGRNYADEQQFI